MLYCLDVALPYSQAGPWWSGMQKSRLYCLYTKIQQVLYVFILHSHRNLTGFVCGRGNGCKWRWEFILTPSYVLAGFWCKFLSPDAISSGFGTTGCCWRQCTAVVLLQSCRCHILPNLLLCNVRIWSKCCLEFEGVWCVKLSCIFHIYFMLSLQHKIVVDRLKSYVRKAS